VERALLLVAICEKYMYSIVIFIHGIIFYVAIYATQFLSMVSYFARLLTITGIIYVTQLFSMVSYFGRLLTITGITYVTQ